MLFNRRCCNNNMNMGCNTGCNMGCRQPQMEQCVVEPTITKCIEKEFYHEIPQDCQFMQDQYK